VTSRSLEARLAWLWPLWGPAVLAANGDPLLEDALIHPQFGALKHVKAEVDETLRLIYRRDRERLAGALFLVHEMRLCACDSPST
jgi:hypothetical protein